MQAIGGKHPLAALGAHEREEVDPLSASAFGLVLRDFVEALDLPRDFVRTAKAGARGGQGPVGLWQRDHTRVGFVTMRKTITTTIAASRMPTKRAFEAYRL